jgi:hypothetical protein
VAQEDDHKHDKPADVPSLASGDNRLQDEPRSRGPSRLDGGKPTPKPGDIYEIEDDTGAIIITGAPGPGRARKPGRRPPKASPMGDAKGQKGG